MTIFITARWLRSGVRREAYYTDYLGAPQEFISAAKYGYLFQGQPYSWQKAPRGTWALGAPPEAFVAFLENHDQIANTHRRPASALRNISRPISRHDRAAAARSLDAAAFSRPGIWRVDRPFLYFSDIGDDNLREAIRKGRFEFLSQFPSLANAETQKQLPIPTDPNSFTPLQVGFFGTEKEQTTLRFPYRSYSAATRRFALSGNKRPAAWMAPSSERKVSCSVISRRKMTIACCW